MYRDIAQWARVRASVLDDGESISAVCRAEGICSQTVHRMLLYERPPGYQQAKPRKVRVFQDQFTTLTTLFAENDLRSKSARNSTEEIFEVLRAQEYEGSFAAVRYHMRCHEDTNENQLWDAVQWIVRTLSEAEATQFLAALFPKGTLVNKTAAAERRRQAIHQLEATFRPAATAQLRWATWLSDLEQKGTVENKTLAPQDVTKLLEELLPAKAKERKKALVGRRQNQAVAGWRAVQGWLTGA